MTLLAQLSNAAGTPGHEQDVRTIIQKELTGVGEFAHDRLGSVICRKPGTYATPKVMLAGHLDEVGFMVRYITNEGFIKFHPLGGWWEHTLLAQPVLILTAKGKIPGVIGAKPIHHLKEEEKRKLLDIKEMFIDVGAQHKQEALEVFGIRPGDHIVPAAAFTPLANPRLVSGKAFDDRVGVALMIETLKHFVDHAHPNMLYGVGTVQEEVGIRGADTAVDHVDPDVAFVLEGSPADDLPGASKDEAQGVLGQGAQIRLFDPTMITNRKLAEFVIETAKSCKIPHQVAVRTSGGTDAGSIHVHRIGVPTVVLGVPVRYSHSHIGVLHLDDYDATLHLLIQLLQRLNTDTARSFTEF